MYSTCIFCHSALGANDSIEHFPVGKRLAYDAAKGRLWVVCPKCERWNLSPIEERWEAIEDAERVYGDTKKRAATDNVGLARLNDGTDLIRIGKPLRPEFAAWRYGEIFGKRRSMFLKQIIGVTVAAQVAGRWGMSAAAAVGAGGLALQVVAGITAGLLQASRTKISVKDGEGRIRQLARGEAWTARYAFDQDEGGAILDITSRHGVKFSSAVERSWQRVRSLSAHAYDERFAIRLTGDNALHALSNMMPAVNLAGGSEKEITRATELVEESKSPQQIFRNIATGKHQMRWQPGNSAALFRVNPDIRLALEMSLHESDEHRAMDGELRELEQRWKDAEEIANIADGLTLPEGIDDKVDALKRKGTYVSDR